MKIVQLVTDSAGALARRSSAMISPYANMTTIGLGFLAGAAFTFGLAAGLAAIGVGCLLAEFNAEKR